MQYLVLNKIIIFPSNRPPVASVPTPRPSDARVGGSAPAKAEGKPTCCEKMWDFTSKNGDLVGFNGI